MNRKQAHQRKNRYSYYNRNSSTQWADDYTAEQLKWLWENKHIEFSNPLYDLGETDNQKYIKFTKKGRLLQQVQLQGLSLLEAHWLEGSAPVGRYYCQHRTHRL
mgnify:CR=1 FL=1